MYIKVTEKGSQSAMFTQVPSLTLPPLLLGLMTVEKMSRSARSDSMELKFNG